MRLKCQPARLKKAETCRLCGQPLQEGYLLKGPVTGYTCENCYQRFYEPLARRTAFHITDIFTRSFWRPFHIEEGVVMFPALSVSAMNSFTYLIRRGIPVLLIAAFLLSGPILPMLQRIPGHFLHVLSQAGQLLLGTGGRLMIVLGHLLDAGGMFLAAFLRMGGQLIEWISGLI